MRQSLLCIYDTPICKPFYLLFPMRYIFFHYICFQISRLVGLFNIGEPKQKVEFQTEMFPCVFSFHIPIIHPYSIYCNPKKYRPDGIF